MEKQSQITDLEQLKEMWNDLNNRLERLERIERQTLEEGKKVSSHKVRTAKEDLAARYRKFMSISLTAGLLFPIYLFLASGGSYPEGTAKYVSTSLFFIYFMTAAAMDFYLYKEVNRIDLASMTVMEVISRARTLKHRHHIFMAILIPFAAITLGVFASQLIDDPFILAGMATGAVAGIAIGLRQYLRMMRDYREMMEEYDS